MKAKKERLGRAVSLLKMLSHPVRLSILCDLAQKGEMTAGDIVAAQAAMAGQSQVSQFLARMRADGLVATRKQAQTVYYRIRAPEVGKVIDALYRIYCGGK